MKKLNIAFIGIGRIGKIHLRNMLNCLPDANVVAVADTNFSADEFKNEFKEIYFSSDPVDVISISDVDAVVICTPTSSHADLIEKSITSGKHIFCEKPVDLSLERTSSLVKKAKEAGIKLMLGFNRRFDPDFLQARENIQAGRIGDVQIVKIN